MTYTIDILIRDTTQPEVIVSLSMFERLSEDKAAVFALLDRLGSYCDGNHSTEAELEADVVAAAYDVIADFRTMKAKRGTGL